jgi:serine/threonine-protein kinase
VFRIARETVRGLRAAFRAGYTHGDVKPGNLLLGADGAVRVADFGLARPVGAAPSGLDRIDGSWPYLAPERFEGGGDHRADVYALGLTLYHLLSGTPPVGGATPAECRARHRSLALEPLHWWLPDVSRAASALVLRMAARNPDDRPADYDALLAELLRLSPRPAADPTPTQPRTR